MDAWHGTLLGCISTLGGVVAAQWKAGQKREQKHNAQLMALHAQHAAEMTELHEAHVSDVKTLAREATELARALTSAPPLKLPAPRRPGSGG